MSDCIAARASIDSDLINMVGRFMIDPPLSPGVERHDVAGTCGRRVSSSRAS
jgi:hypothetical protein